MSRRPFFYRETHGIRVTVRPTYLPEQSRPHARHYVFAYYVRIENVGKLPAQLLSRRWRIHDSIGEDSQVEGEGVIGVQPQINPGDKYQYVSGCNLRTEMGKMYGTYSMENVNNNRLFDVIIPAFEMTVPFKMN